MDDVFVKAVYEQVIEHKLPVGDLLYADILNREFFYGVIEANTLATPHSREEGEICERYRSKSEAWYETKIKDKYGAKSWEILEGKGQAELDAATPEQRKVLEVVGKELAATLYPSEAPFVKYAIWGQRGRRRIAFTAFRCISQSIPETLSNKYGCGDLDTASKIMTRLGMRKVSQRKL